MAADAQGKDKETKHFGGFGPKSALAGLAAGQLRPPKEWGVFLSGRILAPETRERKLNDSIVFLLVRTKKTCSNTLIPADL